MFGPKQMIKLLYRVNVTKVGMAGPDGTDYSVSAGAPFEAETIKRRRCSGGEDSRRPEILRITIMLYRTHTVAYRCYNMVRTAR